MPKEKPQMRRTARSLPYPTLVEPVRRLGCPFYKNSPSECPGVCQTFSCLPKRLPDLTQHIELHHLQQLHCPICGQPFDGPSKEAKKAEHTRLMSCSRQNFSYPGVTPDNLARLKDVKNITQRDAKPQIDAPGATTNHERRWYWMFRVVLPLAPFPMSPHFIPPIVSAPNHVALGRIRSFRAEGHPSQIAQSLGCEEPLTPLACIDHVLDKLEEYVAGSDGGTRPSPAAVSPATPILDPMCPTLSAPAPPPSLGLIWLELEPADPPAHLASASAPPPANTHFPAHPSDHSTQLVSDSAFLSDLNQLPSTMLYGFGTYDDDAANFAHRTEEGLSHSNYFNDEAAQP